MIFKYSIQLVDTEAYIVGSRLISEDGFPSGEYEFTKTLNQSLLDENDRLQWTIKDNPDYDPKTDHIDDRYLIENKPIPLTAEEIETKRVMEVKAKISAELPNLIYDNKDDPAKLAKALTDRAKEIDAETAIKSITQKKVSK